MSMTKKAIHALLGAAMILCALTVFAAPGLAADEHHPAIQRLMQKIAAITTISSDFQQVMDIPMFQEQVVTSGHFLFKRPDGLLWEYTAPSVEGFSLQGGKGSKWSNSRSNKQPFTAAHDPAAAIIAEQLVSWVTLDMAWIQKTYSVDVAGTEPVVLFLTPKSKGMREIIQSLQITFADSGLASSVVIKEAQGGTTTIRFSKSTLNGTLDDALFKY